MTTCNKAQANTSRTFFYHSFKKQGLDSQILDKIFLEMESPLPRLL